MDEVQVQLPVTRDQEYSYAILQELRAIRKALTAKPDEGMGPGEVKLREPAKR